MVPAPDTAALSIAVPPATTAWDEGWVVKVGVAAVSPAI